MPTIHEETLGTPVGADELLYWSVSGGYQRRAVIATLLGATLTGAGTIATGGYTLTIPATGTASLLALAQTYSALKTFSAGINLGNTTLSNYLQGTWTPVFTGSGSNPTVAYYLQIGQYTRIGNLVFYYWFIQNTTISGGSGDLRISLPIAVGSPGFGSVYVNNVDLSGTTASLFSQPTTGTSYSILNQVQDDAALITLPVSALANTDSIAASGFYFA